MESTTQIPSYVIEGLTLAMESAAYNMGDQIGVISWLDGHGWYAAAEWLANNPDSYMDALNEMGQTAARQAESVPTPDPDPEPAPSSYAGMFAEMRAFRDKRPKAAPLPERATPTSKKKKK